MHVNERMMNIWMECNLGSKWYRMQFLCMNTMNYTSLRFLSLLFRKLKVGCVLLINVLSYLRLLNDSICVLHRYNKKSEEEKLFLETEYAIYNNVQFPSNALQFPWHCRSIQIVVSHDVADHQNCCTQLV
jgi:hypothetical protein